MDAFVATAWFLARRVVGLLKGHAAPSARSPTRPLLEGFCVADWALKKTKLIGKEMQMHNKSYLRLLSGVHPPE